MSPFHSLFSVMYFAFLCCIVGVGALLAKTVAPSRPRHHQQHCTEVLPNIPKTRSF